MLSYCNRHTNIPLLTSFQNVSSCIIAHTCERPSYNWHFIYMYTYVLYPSCKIYECMTKCLWVLENLPCVGLSEFDTVMVNTRTRSVDDIVFTFGEKDMNKLLSLREVNIFNRFSTIFISWLIFWKERKAVEKGWKLSLTGLLSRQKFKYPSL